MIHDLLHRLHADPAWYQIAADVLVTIGAALAVIAHTAGRTRHD